MKTLEDALDNVPILFGLKAQGHIPTIAQMLSEGKDWEAIGNVIGWCPKTAKKHYEKLLMPLTEHYAGFNWIKVKRYGGWDKNIPAEENYSNLQSHHEKETNFLIAEVRKLAAIIDERKKQPPERTDENVGPV